MLKRLIKTCSVLILLNVASHAYGQKATEIFIPVGGSPGLSGKYTSIGKIDTVHSEEQTFYMSDSTRSYSIKITDSTKVWLDRSKLQLTNRKGSFEDIKPGLLVEVKYFDNKRDGVAEWIKVQLKQAQQ